MPTLQETLTFEDILKYPELIPPHIAQDMLRQMDPVRWIEHHMRTEKGLPIDYDTRPYLREYARDFHKEMSVKKSSQTGVTTTTVHKALYFGDNKHVTMIYTFPTQDEVEKFSSVRFKPMIQESPYIRSRMADVDNASVKKIGNSVIYFRGTFNTRQALSVPSDLNIHDELDFSDSGVRDIYTSRLSSPDSLKMIWEFSTPTLPDTGIDASFKVSDQKHWLVKCVHCYKWQKVSFFKNIFRKKKRGRWYWGCKHCEKPLYRKRGTWVARYPERTEHGKGIRGYFIHSPIMPGVSAEYLKERYAKAKKTNNGMKKFFNFDLGLTYQSGQEIISKELILKRLGDIPDARYQFIFMGVDQGDQLHIELRGVINGHHTVFYVENTKIENIKRLSGLIEQYNITTCVMDALPNKQTAKEFRDKHRGKVYIAYYTTPNVQGLWNPRDEEKEPYSITINHLDVMDDTAAQWHKGDIHLANTLPINMIEQFAEQMANLKRDVIEDKNGQNIPRWVKTGADHFRHADAYAYIASKMAAYGEVPSENLLGGYIAPPKLEYSGFTQDEQW